MAHIARFSAVWSIAVALGVVLAPATTLAQRNAWRALRIDGTSSATLEASVASMQNALPASQRADFEVALALIWADNSTRAGDVDQDGQLEIEDILELKADTADLLAAIQRGDFVSAIEALDQGGAEYTAADYFAQLDGLSVDAVLDLAGRPDESPQVGRAVKATKAQVLCRDVQDPDGYHPSAVRRRWCDRYFRSPAAASVRTVATGEALSAALTAMRAGDTDAAEKSLAGVDLDELSAFDRGVAETTWAAIRYRQRLYPQAREHLQAAVDTEIMTQGDLEVIVGFIERLERMSQGVPPGVPAAPGVPASGDPLERTLPRAPR
jgi:hypothetical protein